MRGRRRTLGWLAAAMVLLAPGCWLQSGFDARRSGNNAGETTITAANVASLTRAWSVPGTTAAGDPVVNGGTAYLSTGTAVEARNLATGALRWSAPVTDVKSLASAGGHLWGAAGDTGCSFTALDPATGAVVTERSFGGNSLPGGSSQSFCNVSEVLATGNTVATSWSYFAGALAPGPCFPNMTFQSGAGTITLDAVTGALVSQTGGLGTPGCALDPPEPANTLSSDGAVTYMPLGNLIRRFGTCGGSPCGALTLPAGTSAGAVVVPAAGGRLVLTASPNQLLVLNASTGAVEWSASFPIAQFAHPAVTGTTIYLTGADGLVAAFPLAGCGAASCSPSWSHQSGEVSGSPRVGGNLVYVAAGQGNEVRVYAAGGCGAATCAPVAAVHLTGPTFISPVVDSATLFAQEGSAVAAYRLP